MSTQRMNHGKRQIETTGKTLSQIRAEAGMLGAIALGNKFESDEDYVEFMRRAGSKGGQATTKKYRIEPLLQSDYLMVDRATGKPVARLSGEPIPEWMKE